MWLLEKTLQAIVVPIAREKRSAARIRSRAHAAIAWVVLVGRVGMGTGKVTYARPGCQGEDDEPCA